MGKYFDSQCGVHSNISVKLGRKREVEVIYLQLIELHNISLWKIIKNKM